MLIIKPNIFWFDTWYGTLLRMTQKELAKKSGVGLRSIQIYEQRQKYINKASVESIYRIARILGCSVEDIIEKKGHG